MFGDTYSLALRAQLLESAQQLNYDPHLLPDGTDVLVVAQTRAFFNADLPKKQNTDHFIAVKKKYKLVAILDLIRRLGKPVSLDDFRAELVTLSQDPIFKYTSSSWPWQKASSLKTINSLLTIFNKNNRERSLQKKKKIHALLLELVKRKRYDEVFLMIFSKSMLNHRFDPRLKIFHYILRLGHSEQLQDAQFVLFDMMLQCYVPPNEGCLRFAKNLVKHGMITSSRSLINLAKYSINSARWVLDFVVKSEAQNNEAIKLQKKIIDIIYDFLYKSNDAEGLFRLALTHSFIANRIISDRVATTLLNNHFDINQDWVYELGMRSAENASIIVSNLANFRYLKLVHLFDLIQMLNEQRFAIPQFSANELKLLFNYTINFPAKSLVILNCRDLSRQLPSWQIVQLIINLKDHPSELIYKFIEKNQGYLSLFELTQLIIYFPTLHIKIERLINFPQDRFSTNDSVFLYREWYKAKKKADKNQDVDEMTHPFGAAKHQGKFNQDALIKNYPSKLDKDGVCGGLVLEFLRYYGKSILKSLYLNGQPFIEKLNRNLGFKAKSLPALAKNFTNRVFFYQNDQHMFKDQASKSKNTITIDNIEYCTTELKHQLIHEIGEAILAKLSSTEPLCYLSINKHALGIVRLYDPNSSEYITLVFDPNNGIECFNHNQQAELESRLEGWINYYLDTSDKLQTYYFTPGVIEKPDVLRSPSYLKEQTPEQSRVPLISPLSCS